MFDNGGDSVSIITSGPATDNYQGQSGKNGLTGHTAINVDGKVFSFEGNGKWAEPPYSYSEYLKNESKTRTVIEQTVNVDQSKVQAALDSRKNGTYNVENNSCVTNTMSVLKVGGIPLKAPNGAVSPEQLSNTLQGSKYVTNATRTPSTSQSSFVGQMLYNFIGWLFSKGVNTVGAKPNTDPLLDKEHEK
jgi:hypothetical protein